MLAMCINGSCTDGALLLGEYYDIYEHILSPSPNEGYAVVKVFAIPDIMMMIENFSKASDLEGDAPDYFVLHRHPEELIYLGSLARFEILIAKSQVEAACHKIQERRRYVSGEYKK